MCIQIDETKKQVLVWLTNNDQTDEAQQEKLRSLYQEYGAKKYMVAVFCSGKEDLVPLTSHLLCHNRICAAKAELRREEEKRQTETVPEIESEEQKEEQSYQGPTMMFG